MTNGPAKTIAWPLVLYKQINDRLGEANTLLGLGELQRKLGRNEQARTAYDQAITLFKQIDDRHGEANAQFKLGDLHLISSRRDEAEAAYEQAMDIYKQIDDRLGQANVYSAARRFESARSPQ